MVSEQVNYLFKYIENVLVESALQNVVSVYRKHFNQEHRRNLLENLKMNLTKLKDVM